MSRLSGERWCFLLDACAHMIVLHVHVLVMVIVIYSALVRSHESSSLVASASCVPRGYNTRAQPCLKIVWRSSPDLPQGVESSHPPTCIRPGVTATGGQRCSRRFGSGPGPPKAQESYTDFSINQPLII